MKKLIQFIGTLFISVAIYSVPILFVMSIIYNWNDFFKAVFGLGNVFEFLCLFIYIWMECFDEGM